MCHLAAHYIGKALSFHAGLSLGASVLPEPESSKHRGITCGSTQTREKIVSPVGVGFKGYRRISAQFGELVALLELRKLWKLPSVFGVLKDHQLSILGNDSV